MITAYLFQNGIHVVSNATLYPVVWSIIPARGGSKGILDKNLQKIQGRSLVARSVDVALNVGFIKRVFVSTESDRIAAEAARAGAEIVNRPTELASDTASSESALLDALEQLKAAGEKLPEVIVFQQCTSPFVAPEDVIGTVDTLLRENADTALAVVACHICLWQRGVDGSALGVNHSKTSRLRRQDRTADYRETGAVYAMRTAGFLAARHRFFGKTVLYEMPTSRAWEIDTQEDLAFAQAIAPVVETETEAEVLSVNHPLGHRTKV